MLRAKLTSDMTTALKNRDSQRLTTLRYIVAQIKNREIEKKSELSDEETVGVLQKNAKDLRESIVAFEKGNRPDLAEDSKKQLEIISVYLPVPMTDDELKNAVSDLLTKNKAAYDANPKAIIGICMRELKNKADSSRILFAIQTLTKT